MACLVAALVLSGAIVHAAPPTVVPSPGYDARLQEQHKALSATSTPATVQPVTPRRHRTKRKH
jgi:hypothetical protein